MSAATVQQQEFSASRNGLLPILCKNIAAFVASEDSETAWRERHEAVRWFYGLDGISPTYHSICLDLAVDPAVLRNALFRNAAEIGQRLLAGEAIEKVTPEATGRLPIPQASILRDDASNQILWQFEV